MAAIRKTSKRTAFRRIGGGLKKVARKVFPKKKPTGLLDLPGEIRNRIYDYLVNNPPLRALTAVMSTSRQLHAEFLPLVFQQKPVAVALRGLKPFVDVFFGSGAPMALSWSRPEAFQIRVDMIPGRGDVLDLQGLLRFVLGHMGAEVVFVGDKAWQWHLAAFHASLP